MDKAERIVGCLLGGAVGDAIGLPYEGLTRAAIGARVGAGPLGHALICGRGMLSDDSEHACMTAQALLASGGELRRFTRSLAWRLRGWLLGLPASVGFGTLRALIRLWLGWSPERSGVNSAGNGPAMRAAILGACLGADEVAAPTPPDLRAAVGLAGPAQHLDAAHAAVAEVQGEDAIVDVVAAVGRLAAHGEQCCRCTGHGEQAVDARAVVAAHVGRHREW